MTQVEKIETFPENITVSVLDDASNAICASNAQALTCVTDFGERMRIDFTSSGDFAPEELHGLIGKRVNIGFVSTARYFANRSTIVPASDAMLEATP